MKRTCWELQTLYESRYVTSDYVHRVLCMIRYLCVGFAIYNIEYAEAFGMNVFGFTLGILAELILSMGLRLELYFKGLGDKIAIQNHTLDDFKFEYAALFVLYSAAFIVAAVQYDQTKKESAGSRQRSAMQNHGSIQGPLTTLCNISLRACDLMTPLIASIYEELSLSSSSNSRIILFGCV